jgi:3-deoxy-D-manno-octulosonic-acid transferase
MNELGLFYRLCPIVAMGASFEALGGHNPIEPAQLGQALILGPHMHNFSEIAQEFQAEAASIQLATSDELTAALDQLLQNEAARLALGRAAKNLVEGKRSILNNILKDLQPWLSRPGFA